MSKLEELHKELKDKRNDPWGPIPKDIERLYEIEKEINEEIFKIKSIVREDIGPLSMEVLLKRMSDMENKFNSETRNNKIMLDVLSRDSQQLLTKLKELQEDSQPLGRPSSKRFFQVLGEHKKNVDDLKKSMGILKTITDRDRNIIEELKEFKKTQETINEYTKPKSDNNLITAKCYACGSILGLQTQN